MPSGRSATPGCGRSTSRPSSPGTPRCRANWRSRPRRTSPRLRARPDCGRRAVRCDGAAVGAAYRNNARTCARSRAARHAARHGAGSSAATAERSAKAPRQNRRPRTRARSPGSPGPALDGESSTEDGHGRRSGRRLRAAGAEHRLSADEPPRPMSMFERFATLLHAGGTIAAAPPAPPSRRRSVRQRCALLRPERCHLVSAGAVDGTRSTTQSGETLSTASAARCSAGDRRRAVPVVALDGRRRHRQPAAVRHPLRARGADLRQRRGRWSACTSRTQPSASCSARRRRQLAAFIAALGGAGLRAPARQRDAVPRAGAELQRRHHPRRHRRDRQRTRARRPDRLRPAATALVGREVSAWAHPDDVAGVREVLGRRPPAGCTAPHRMPPPARGRVIPVRRERGHEPARRADHRRARPQHP